eukprot:156345_1
MSDTQTNTASQIHLDIEAIARDHATISDAINTLKKQLPFIDEETLYKIITGLLKYNKHLSLTDNFQTELVDNDTANEEAEDLIKSFHPDEITKLQDLLMSDEEKTHYPNDEKQEHTSKETFKMNWMKICECVSHEMWPKLSSVIKGIIRENNVNIYEINNESITTIFNALKKRTIQIEPLQYLKALIQRAMAFSINNNNNNNNTDKYNIP